VLAWAADARERVSARALADGTSARSMAKPAFKIDENLPSEVKAFSRLGHDTVGQGIGAVRGPMKSHPSVLD
jgi:hypothetical protein